MTEIYDSGSYLLIKSGYGNPDMHSHSAAHILLASRRMQIVTPKLTAHCMGALIPSGVSHTIQNDGAALVFMFDETTVVAEQIKEVRILEDETVQKILNAFEKVEESGRDNEVYQAFVEEAMRLIGIRNIRCRATDERILNALSYIDSRIGENPTCGEVAAYACLSESRFSHLFREQTGITFAGYVILRKLQYAFLKIAGGENITQAALDAGFADSAHFAAVNKKTFGLTASAVGRELKYYRMNR